MRRAAGVSCLGLWLLTFAAGGRTGDTAGPRHLIYLHGRIVQTQQSPRPKSDRFGYYELEKILDAFRAKGFAVSGEIRPKGTSESGGADRVVARVRELLDSGVPPDRIAVVGASMGAGIAMVASARLQNPEVKFVVLGACLSENARRIREESDESTRSCPRFGKSSGSKSLSVREILLRTGLDHGYLYRPLPGWVDPAAEFAKSR